MDVEVKGGHIVYRKFRKSVSGATLRRSPRKSLSPLKSSYLGASSRTGRRSGGPQKLFSPQGPSDFLEPAETAGKRSPRKSIPSPVKFRVANEEEVRAMMNENTSVPDPDLAREIEL